MEFSRFDVCLGYYWAAVMNNGTQAAEDIWRRLEDIGYRPSRSEEHIPETEEEASERGLDTADYVLCGLLGAY